MSKRLQVVVGDEELEGYARTAEAVGLTMSEWVRQSLRAAEREVSTGDVEAKLAAIRKAASYNFPIPPDIDTLLAEMEAGRLAEIEAGMPGAGDV
ncbi:MAG: antitoxin [Solirubrobacteraceae bacterium]